MNNHERLNEIDRLFGEIIATLDNSQTQCECCTGYRYNTLGDHYIYERVAAARKKMHGLAQSTAEWMDRE